MAGNRMGGAPQGFTSSQQAMAGLGPPYATPGPVHIPYQPIPPGVPSSLLPPGYVFQQPQAISPWGMHMGGMTGQIPGQWMNNLPRVQPWGGGGGGGGAGGGAGGTGSGGGGGSASGAS